MDILRPVLRQIGDYVELTNIDLHSIIFFRLSKDEHLAERLKTTIATYGKLFASLKKYKRHKNLTVEDLIRKSQNDPAILSDLLGYMYMDARLHCYSEQSMHSSLESGNVYGKIELAKVYFYLPIEVRGAETR